MFTAALLTAARAWKPPERPATDAWVNQPWHTVTVEHYSAMRKKETLPFATPWMDLEGIMLSEISQAEEDVYRTAPQDVEPKRTETQRAGGSSQGLGGELGTRTPASWPATGELISG